MRLKIGNVSIDGLAALAPMAGVADRAFRELCVRFGASYVVSEMVSARGISFFNDKTINLLRISRNEHPCAIQIFGDDPDIMANAAAFALNYEPDIIDINFGCPAPKVNKSGGGAILMKSPELCARIVTGVKRVVNIPVTVKIRTGWDYSSVNAPFVAKLCENSGADAIVIHGRTRDQMFRPGVDLDTIAKVKASVSVPVIGNGDITCGQDAYNMLHRTECDMIMVGRAALGNPWVFSEVNHFLDPSNYPYTPPSIEEKLQVMLFHTGSICCNEGETLGIMKARRHIISYIRGIPFASAFRDRASRVTCMRDVEVLAEEILNTCRNDAIC